MSHKFLTDKAEIITWLNYHKIKNYELIPDDTKDDLGNLKYGYLINVGGYVALNHSTLTHIPVKFNIINGYFDCSFNNLITLQDFPEIVNGIFNCSNNELTTLNGCPKTVNGDFSCSYNELTTLEGCPDIVKDFNCSYNKLTTLKGCPNKVYGYFICANNELNTLEFIPENIVGKFSCKNNPKLGYLQDIRDFNEIKEISNALKEQKFLNNELSVVNNCKKDIIKV